MFWPISGKLGSKAGLKTYADAVAEAMQAKTPGKTKLTMSVDRWKTFAASVSTRKSRACGVDGDRRLLELGSPRTPEGFYEVTGGRDMATARIGDGPIRRFDLARNSSARPGRR
jgi:hypothetical protein